ncbi:MAG: DNA alkylation repair protein, partial [Anaerofustis stercorihominis]|nr:DNA alkylation repair protein [Anaerofustis stercorihominis]
MDIQELLFGLGEEKYGDFQSKLIPSVDREKIIGVRMPKIREIANMMVSSGCSEHFLDSLPHRYYDEDQLHAVLISNMSDYDQCLRRTEDFLGFIDNWCTCDTLSPKIFAANREDLLEHIRIWINSSHTYTVRFAIKMLMDHFLGDNYKKEYSDMVAGVVSDEYYVNMMIAWYFATALAKNYGQAILYLENRTLDTWIHNKTIQKARES